MSVVITRDDIIAYAEVDYIIHHMNEKYINKIQEKLLNFFSTIKDPNHEIYVNPRVPLQNQNLKKYTLEIIALLHIKYWCEDEERRQMLYEKMMENQRKLDAHMREKYNIDNMFNLNSAKGVNSVYDLEESDYSKPKNITKYSNMVEDNPDITDYTDVEEDKLNNYLHGETNQIKQQQSNENAMVPKTSFLTKFVNKIKNIFTRK